MIVVSGSGWAADGAHELDSRVTESIERAMNGVVDFLGNELCAVLLKGSVVDNKGVDYIEGFSDIDFHLYMSSSAMRGPVTPNAAIAFGLQRLLGGDILRTNREIDLQISFWDTTQLASHSVQPLPGSYRVIFGRLPPSFSEGTSEEYWALSQSILANLASTADQAVRWAADLRDEELVLHLRKLMSWTKPALRASVAVLTKDVLSSWTGSVEYLSNVIEPAVSLPVIIRDMYQQIRENASAGWEPEVARHLIETGVEVLDQLATHVSVSDR